MFRLHDVLSHNQNGPLPKQTITKMDYTKTDHNQSGLPEKNMYCKNLYLVFFLIVSLLGFFKLVLIVIITF